MVAIPQSGMLAQVSSLWLHSGHSGPIPKKHFSPHLPAQPPLASGGCGRLLCFSTGSYHWARNLWVVIIYLFFLPLMLPSEVQSLATDSPVKVFPGVWKLLSFYLLYFFLPPLKTMGCFSGCLMSSAGIQKLFCGIYSVFKCSLMNL